MKDKTVRELRDDLDAIEGRLREFISKELLQFMEETGFEIGEIKVEPYENKSQYEGVVYRGVHITCHIKDLML